MTSAIDYKDRILTHLQDRFGDRLFAVVLFGSRARQTARAFSDIDVLIVLNGAPKEHRKRRQLASSIRRQLSLPIDTTILSPRAFVYSVRYCAPLTIELACAYEVWHEKDEFFSQQIQFMHSLMQRGKLFQLQTGVWKLLEDLDEVAPDGFRVSA